jgi:hypothetical protein
MSVMRRPFTAAGEVGRPLYARVLRLRHLHPSGALCFVFLEGAMALGVLLALAELITMWGVLILPACVAAMVKINDMIAGAVVRSAERAPALRPDRVRRPSRSVVGRARVPRDITREPRDITREPQDRVYRSADAPALPSARAPADLPDTPVQRVRQSATRRYE